MAESVIWDFLRKLEKLEECDSNYAVLILNQPILCSPDLIKLLWKKASFRATADGGTNRWLNFILRDSGENFPLPDIISGDFDSIKANTRDFFESRGVKFIHTPDQDETDFSKALRCIDESLSANNVNIKWVIVVCENGGRFDQVIGNINTLHRSNDFIKDVPVIIFSSQSVTWVLRPGNHIIQLTDNYAKEQYACGLIPTQGPTIITTTGLKWNLDKQESVMGGLVSTSNTYIAAEISITCDKDLIWTTEYCKSD